MLENIASILKELDVSRDEDVQFRSEKFRPQSKSQGTFDFINLSQNWASIVGEMLASNTAPFRISNKTLFILVKHSTFSNELSFLSQQIIKKIVQHYPSLKGKIDKIYFKTNPQYFAQAKKEVEKKETIQKSKPHRFSPEHIKRKKEAEQVCKDIEDEEFKDLLESIYVQHSPKS